MSIQKNQFSPEVKALCIGCSAFFGYQAFAGYCSSCFKKNQPELKSQRKQSTETNVSTGICKVELIRQVDGIDQIIEQEPHRQQKDKKRCFTCNKKVGLLGIECKCSFVYCNTHRLPQEHQCEFNHKQQAKKRLQAQLIKVDCQKIRQI